MGVLYAIFNRNISEIDCYSNFYVYLTYRNIAYNSHPDAVRGGVVKFTMDGVMNPNIEVCGISTTLRKQK